MTLEEHAEAIKKAIEAAEDAGFTVETSGGCGHRLTLLDGQGREADLGMY